MCRLFALLSIGFFAVRANAAPSVDERELIAALIESLDDPDGEVRQNIAVAIANLGEAAVPALIEALADEKAERRAGGAGGNPGAAQGRQR
jgi:HEAT repeat protein